MTSSVHRSIDRLTFIPFQACNNAGWSYYSTVCETTMPPSSPSAVPLLRCSTTPTTIAVSWSEPASNGSPILHYNVDVGDRLLTSDQLQHELVDMQPETTYKIRVQAVNAVGAGPFSTTLRATTPPLPPLPPALECAAQAHNSLKLKWGDGRNPTFMQYAVEMENPRTEE